MWGDITLGRVGRVRWLVAVGSGIIVFFGLWFGVAGAGVAKDAGLGIAGTVASLVVALMAWAATASVGTVDANQLLNREKERASAADGMSIGSDIGGVLADRRSRAEAEKADRRVDRYIYVRIGLQDRLAAAALATYISGLTVIVVVGLGTLSLEGVGWGPLIENIVVWMGVQWLLAVVAACFGIVARPWRAVSVIVICDGWIAAIVAGLVWRV
jgi:hypothetical protein